MPEELPALAIAVPAELEPAELHLEVAPFGDITLTTEAVRAALVEQGVTVSDVRELGPEAMALQGIGGSPRTRFLVFVNAGEWPSELVDAILGEYYAVVAGLTGPNGILSPPGRVAFVGAAEPPFALQYLYSGAWWGALEAELYREFGNPSLNPNDSEPFIAIARDVFHRYGLSLGGHPYRTLDRLMAELPRPEEPGAAYQPVATLVAIGLVLGDSLERRHERVSWVPGAEVMGQYFGLTAGDDALRPIDFVIQIYRRPIEDSIQDYSELVRGRAEIE
ncbi:MAG: hypothetical protein ACJAYU_003696 [Bradymonadia bacterium]